MTILRWRVLEVLARMAERALPELLVLVAAQAWISIPMAVYKHAVEPGVGTAAMGLAGVGAQLAQATRSSAGPRVCAARSRAARAAEPAAVVAVRPVQLVAAAVVCRPGS